MKRPYRPTVLLRKANFVFLLLGAPLLASAAGTWDDAPDRLARIEDGRTLWSFTAEDRFDKPHFHPLAARNGLVLTSESPADHLWHYGLWFSWKYINHVNFWEKDKKTGRPEGRTQWEKPTFLQQDDGSAEIRMALSYLSPSGAVWLTEARQIRIGPAKADGSYTVDWSAKFTVGSEPVEFERTPMPGEPGGQVNGGYGGFSLRMPVESNKFVWSAAEGAPAKFASGRWRPTGPALQVAMSDATRTGVVAILSHPDNTGGKPATWYVVDNGPMRFACASILAPSVITRNPGESFVLRYRVLVRNEPLSAEALRLAAAQFSD